MWCKINTMKTSEFRVIYGHIFGFNKRDSIGIMKETNQSMARKNMTNKCTQPLQKQKNPKTQTAAKKKKKKKISQCLLLFTLKWHIHQELHKQQ